MSPRRRQPRRRAPLLVPLPVVDDLADVITTANYLAERFCHGHAVAVCAPDGTVLDMWLFSAPRHTAEDAIHTALVGAGGFPGASRAVLVSVLERVDLTTPNELEVEMWHATVNRFARAGLVLWEWVVASGDKIRSLAVTADTESSWRSS